MRNIQRITEKLPEIKHIVMFYDDGTVFQTTFNEPINIPEIGKNLAQSLKHMEGLFETAQIELKHFSKLIYETENYLVIILRLGEGSNLALFFDKGQEEPNISSIRRYLYRIEDLIDTDKLDLERHALEEKRGKLSVLKQEYTGKLEQIEMKKSNIFNLDEKVAEIQKQIEFRNVDLKSEDLIVEKLEGYIDSRKEELKEQIEKEGEKELKQEIKADEKGLSIAKKNLEKIDKELGQLQSDIKKIEAEKIDILSEITILLDESKKIQEKITENKNKISVSEEHFHQKEREKLERVLLMEKLYK